MDVQGRTVKTFSNNGLSNVKLNLSAYNKGLYYVLITTETNIITEKILIK